MKCIAWTTELQIAAPPERVFDGLTDLDEAGKWMKGFVRIDRLNPEVKGVGAKWREVRRMFGREASEEFEVTVWDEPRRLSLFVDGSKGATGQGEFRFDYELTPEGDGTRLVIRNDIRIPGLFFRLFGGLLSGTFRKAIDADMQAFKAHLERSDATA